MIELKPKIETHFSCPECGEDDPIIHDVLIQPVYVLADCICNNCRLEFYQTFPVGHSAEEHLSIKKSGDRVYHKPDSPSWLSDALLKVNRKNESDEVHIEKKVFKTVENVVILNTLDFLYGHVLLKLYNAQYHLDHQQDLGLVVIIPKSFEWLIPKGCAEAWIVDLKLNEMAYGHTSIQEFFSRELERFNKIYLSKAYSHPDYTTIDIERFTGVRPFNLDSYNRLSPVITFVLRKDRWWLANSFGYWFYRFCRKLRWMSWGNRRLAMNQNWLVKRTIAHIRKELRDASFFVAGLGNTGSFTGYAIDKRHATVDNDVEVEWCKLYAQSHVVIGVHGSNMLLPTAFAAGCVEVLPKDRYNNMVQDISVRYNDRKQLFFYRFADQYAKPKSVAEKVISMITDFSDFYGNMCRKIYPSAKIMQADSYR